MAQIRKAIIPAAGLGTRFLPATKTVPKEMLTIVDAPIILYVVEEAVRAGIEDIVLIAGRGKHAIEDFFDTSYEVEDRLAKDGKLALLQRLIDLRGRANIISIRQKEAKGLGHAVYCGLPIIGKDPFAVLLGDEITVESPGRPSTTSLLCRSFAETGVSTVSVIKVSDGDVSKYGIVEGAEEKPGFIRSTGLIEKPAASATKSRWALPGRYVFDNRLMEFLRDTDAGLNGEIQLTDAMETLRREKGLNAIVSDARRFDAGDKLGYLKANIELGLDNHEIGTELKKYLLELSETLRKG